MQSIRLVALAVLFSAACGNVGVTPPPVDKGSPFDATLAAPASQFGAWEHYLDVGADDPLAWHAVSSQTPADPLFELRGAELRFSLPGFFVGSKVVDGQLYSRVLLPGMRPLDRAGFPELPVVRGSFIVPQRFAGELVVTSATYVDVPLDAAILPSRGPIERSIDPTTVPYLEGAFYTNGKNYPEQEILADQLFTLRALRGLPVQVQPFMYLREQGLLRVYTEIRGQLVSPEPIDFDQSQPNDDPDFMRLYAKVFRNYTPPARYNQISEPGRMIVIAADQFAGAVQPLVEWKNQRGLRTELFTLSQVGSTATDVQTFIKNQYQSAQGLTYVILVGDADHVPTLRGSYEQAHSDSRYAMVAGNDLYPDLFVSRISVRTSAQVQSQVAKFIAYEREPNPAADWYRKGIGIASNEGSPTDAQRAEGLRTALEGYGYTTVAKIYDPGATKTAVAAAVNAGAAIINYIGHGEGSYWVTTGFSNTDVTALTNSTGAWPFIIDVSCQNGTFAVRETCFSEAWLRAGTPSAPTGAIAMFSASTNASWVPPTVMQDHIVKDLLVGEQRATAGGFYYSGSMKVIDQYGSGEGTKLVEQYNIFGDSSLLVRTTTPKALNVTHPSSVNSAGQVTIGVSYAGGGAAKFATAALYANGTLYAAQMSSSGQVTLSYNGLAGAAVTLTVTAHNAVPKIVTLPVQGGGNAPPTANAGADQTAAELATVQLDGSASSDPEGSALSATWTQVAGPAVTLSGANTLTPSFVVPNLDSLTTFTFQLVVNDGELSSAPDTVNVVVYGEIEWDFSASATDVPKAIPDNNATGITSQLAVSAAGSVANAEVELAITHTYIGDLKVTLFCPASGSQVLHANAGGSADNIAQKYTVTACAGQAATGTWKLTVADTASSDTGTLTAWKLRLNLDGATPNTPPVANAGADQSVQSGATVTLSAVGSSDPDGDTLSYAWAKTSGPAITLTGASTATPSFVAPTVTSATVAVFTLTVSDGQASATDTVQITINPLAVNHQPVAEAGADQSATAGDAVTLEGSASDADGDALTYAWTQTAGPNVSLTGASTLRPSFTAPAVSAATTLGFRLTVSDGQASASDTVDVVVSPASASGWELVATGAGVPLNILDNNATGISSTATVDRHGAISTLEVEVNITHTYIGDLRVILTCPSGTQVTLHNRTGGSADNIYKTFSVTACNGQDPYGAWKLAVADLASADTGKLVSWNVHVWSGETQPSGQLVQASATDVPLAIPDSNLTGVYSRIPVATTGTVANLQVAVAITHPYVGALQATLICPSGTQVILHNYTGGSAANINTTYTVSECNGQPSNGTWQLWLRDKDAYNDNGKLTAWSVRLQTN